ncbi:MAG TPA: 3-deoxy-7-phosphoheptulonate synthase [Syntrophomonadaceae bacterium]|nr:3-deoxy-7-phosphoheptulonate synthase [Syntrophomonadaceae bacterium]
MQSYRLASKEHQSQNTIIKINTDTNEVLIGQGYYTLIAGPCAVENYRDYLDLAIFLKENGAHILRGGLFKPRTSPYSFRGLGREGLAIMAEARRITGLPIITEIMDVRDLDYMFDSIDILQVGSRNMQNYTLLDELSKVKKPIVLKRGFSATIEEWLLAAEYLLSGGNQEVILCERGIRTFEPLTRNTVDIGAVALIKHLSHLPIIVDPSHATGRWELVIPVSKAALVAGADAIMVEVHQEPDKALSDGEQSLNKNNFQRLENKLKILAKIEEKHIQVVN